MKISAWREVDRLIEDLAVYTRYQMTDEDCSEETLTDNMTLLVRLIELSEQRKEPRGMISGVIKIKQAGPEPLLEVLQMGFKAEQIKPGVYRIWRRK